MPLRYLPAARKDIKDVLKWSAENFGTSAARRYQELLRVALSDIAADPSLDHSYEVRGLQTGIRLYHLRHCRSRAAVEGQMVKNPRHFIAYLVRDADTVIVRVLHDRMEIARQLEESP
ncbi:MAG: type II toxin-antitoxin system RelE/ParE family toxin [Limisphaerales bacterium]